MEKSFVAKIMLNTHLPITGSNFILFDTEKASLITAKGRSIISKNKTKKQNGK